VTGLEEETAEFSVPGLGDAEELVAFA